MIKRMHIIAILQFDMIRPSSRLFTGESVLLAIFLLLISCISLSAQSPEPPKPPPEPKLDSKAKTRIKQAFQDYFKAADDAGREDALKRAGESDPIPASAVSELLSTAFKAAATGARIAVKHETSVETSQGTGSIIIGGVKSGKPQPLLIGLHGGGEGVGEGSECEQKFQPAAAKGCIVVFPTVLKKDATAWNTEREERHVIELIEAVKRTTAVDTNRIYLVGHSMGGFGTWSIGGHYADILAGLGPCAGGVFVVLGGDKPRAAPGVLPNLHNTPVYFYHSTDDAQVPPKADQIAAEVLGALQKEHPGGYKHTYVEYTDIGHGVPAKGMGPLLDYILEFKRDPYPKKIVFEPARSYKRLFAWVEVPAKSAIRKIVAEYDRKKNEIAVTTEGAETGFAVYLNTVKMIDQKKEVLILVNGKERYRGFVQHSAFAILRSAGEFRDPERVFSARIAFE